jgi:hypothetical protein
MRCNGRAVVRVACLSVPSGSAPLNLVVRRHYKNIFRYPSLRPNILDGNTLMKYALRIIAILIATSVAFMAGLNWGLKKGHQEALDAQIFYKLFNAQSFENALERVRDGKISDGIDSAELVIALDLFEAKNDISHLTNEKSAKGFMNSLDRAIEYTKKHPSDKWLNPMRYGLGRAIKNSDDNAPPAP